MLRFIYKTLEYIRVIIKSYISTFWFKFCLFCNGVKFGSNLHTYNAVPSIQINRKAKSIFFGDNFTINNYVDQGWYCKTKIIVNQNATLYIGV